MATVNIDGKEYEFEGRPALLQFCLDIGIEIPYFCYHKEMSTPTNCRMCLIDLGFHARDRATGDFQFDEEGKPKINWGRKPATSCNTTLGPGMFVKTHRTSPEIKTAQEGVLEYMLANHPLDCPICDQAGECPLQIWTYKFGPEGSRFEVKKSHKPKRIELGPNVVMDGERCINCTRCVRFTDEISGSSQLTIINRGDKNIPSTAPGETFDDPYSMNTIDICPVGALTSKQHRFKARVWEMASVDAIDMNDSTGTNINLWVRDNKVLRITPRENMDINKNWMPDAHRLTVDFYNENRVSGAHQKGNAVDFNAGISAAAQLLKKNEGKTLFVGSAYASLESNYALKALAEARGAKEVYYVSHVEEGFGDNWLIQDDRTPNTAACELLGFKALTLDEFKTKVSNDAYSLLYSLENDRSFAALDGLKGKAVIAHAYQHQAIFSDIDVLLPAGNAIEGEGVFINKDNKVQVSRLARQIKQMTPEMWMRVPKSRLDKGAVIKDNWRDEANIFDVLPSWQLVAKVGQALGLDMPYELHKDIFPVIKSQFNDLLGEVKVSYKVPKSAFKTSQLDFAPKW